MNIQDWFPLGLTGWISLQSKGLSRVFSTPQIKSINSSVLSLPYGPALTHTWLQEKPQLWLYTSLSAKWCLCFLICCQVCHSFLSKGQVSSNFMTAITICSDLGAQENKICHCFHFSPSICHEVMGPDAMILVFWMLSFKPAFSLSCFTFIKRLF